MNEQIAIIGMAGMFPMASDVDSYWHNIVERKDCITDVPPNRWPVNDYLSDNDLRDHLYVAKGGFLPEITFDPLQYGIAPNSLSAIDTSQLLTLVTAGQALNDAGYGTEREFDRQRVSVIYGVTGAQELVIPLGARLGHPYWRRALHHAGVSDRQAEQVIDQIANSYAEWHEQSFPGLLGNVVAGRIANRFNFGGSNCVVDAACASSLSALHLACLELRTGLCDMVVTGGVDTFNDPFMYMCFSKIKALASDGRAKPYDRQADGTSLGEAVGCLILKRYQEARDAGDHIYATIINIGTSSDGRGHAVYEPSVDGQVQALRNTYQNIDPATITLLEGHGTGTKVGDHVELQALHKVYCQIDRHKWCALGSVKSQIGHTKAAAGIAGIIKCVLALQHRTIPPTINCNSPHPLLLSPESPFYLANDSQPWPTADYPRRAAVSSFGFGGSNFHCLLEEGDDYRPTTTEVNPSTNGFSVTINGANYRHQTNKTVALSEATADNAAGQFGYQQGTPSMTNNGDLIAAWSRMQEHTAKLHAKFLDGQQQSLQTLNDLLGNGVSSSDQPTTDSSENEDNNIGLSPSLPPPPVASNGKELTNGLLATDSDDLQQTVLAVVADKTGYPTEAINLDMKIEEDLGIDSIKRVEILSALKERYPNLPTNDEQLIVANSLREIVELSQQKKK